MKHREYMRQAIEEAYEGIHAGHGGPFGTVIVKDGKIVGRGHNQVLTREECLKLFQDYTNLPGKELY